MRALVEAAINDTGVTVSRAPAMEHADPSPLTPEIMGPVEKVTRDMFGPGVLVIPTMGTGATDSKYLRAAGIPGYGVSGLFGDPNDARAHGKDERVLIKSYYDSEEFLYRLVKEMSRRRRSRGAALPRHLAAPVPPLLLLPGLGNIRARSTTSRRASPIASTWLL